MCFRSTTSDILREHYKVFKTRDENESDMTTTKKKIISAKLLVDDLKILEISKYVYPGINDFAKQHL